MLSLELPPQSHVLKADTTVFGVVNNAAQLVLLTTPQIKTLYSELDETQQAFLALQGGYSFIQAKENWQIICDPHPANSKQNVESNLIDSDGVLVTTGWHYTWPEIRHLSKTSTIAAERQKIKDGYSHVMKIFNDSLGHETTIWRGNVIKQHSDTSKDANKIQYPYIFAFKLLKEMLPKKTFQERYKIYNGYKNMLEI